MQGDASPGFVSRPALEFSYVGLADAFNRCFEGYVMPVDVSAAALESRCRSETVDLAASRVYEEGDRISSIVLVDRRGRRCRIGALGVAREKRGAGLGARMMRAVIAEARSRGDQEIILEVIEKNAPAVGLYRKLGFEAARRLVGYHRTNATGDGVDLEEIDVTEFSRMAAMEGEQNLPWMLAPESLATYAFPSRAYTLSGHAFALVGDTDPEKATLVAVVVPRWFRHRGWGTRIVRALFAKYPDRGWSIMQIVPEDLAPGFFYRLGFDRDDLTQLEMRLAL